MPVFAGRIPGADESFRYGVEDSLETLDAYMKRIRAYVLKEIGNPFVLDAARKIASGCRPYDQKCEVKKVFDFVTSKVRYAAAPSYYGTEVLQTAEKMLKDIKMFGRASGECEEMVVLLAALLANLNIPVSLVFGGGMLKLPEGKFPNMKHVWAAARIRGFKDWVHLDATGYSMLAPNGPRPGQHFAFETYKWLPIKEE